MSLILNKSNGLGKVVMLATAFAVLAACKDANADKDKAIKLPKVEEGKRAVSCEDLDQTGSVAPETVHSNWTMSNGDQVVVTSTRALTPEQARVAVAGTFQNKLACSAAFNFMKSIDAGNYFEQNPLVESGGSTNDFIRPAKIDGNNLSVSPKEFKGFEAALDTYRAETVICMGHRGRKNTVTRLRKIVSGTTGRCAFPKSYSAQLPDLAVVAQPKVNGLREFCAQRKLDGEGCGKSFSALGGLLAYKLNQDILEPEGDVTFAWSLSSTDTKAVEDQVRSQLNLDARMPFELNSLSSKIRSDDFFPVRAIGFSETADPADVKVWAMTKPHTPHVDPAYDPSARPLLGQNVRDLNGDLVQVDRKSVVAFQSEARSKFASALNFLPFRVGSDKRVTTSRETGKAMSDVYFATVVAGKPLNVFLVWTPSDESVVIKTHLQISPDGEIKNKASQVIESPRVLGLPANLLSL